MKKIKIVIAVFSLLTVALVSQFQNSKTASVLENLEVIALAGGEGVSTGNTGPGQIEDCAGPATGQKKYCMSTNQYPCTESGCN